MTKYLEDKLAKRAAFGNLRQLSNHQNLIDFTSNDYLGLARSKHFVELVREELFGNISHLNGFGATGSRLLSGNTTYVEELENKIALFHEYEAGLLFNCGYMGNLGLISALADKESIIFYDVGVHASTHDGIRLSGARALPFRHNDLEHLEYRLRTTSQTRNRILCVESIYSTDGSKAPLKEICYLANKFDVHLIVDEAHAVGVCGPQGRGLIAAENLMSHVFAQVTTFGKALGVQGAIVLGSKLLRNALINFSRPYIYTTALPLSTLAAIKCSYDIFPYLETERKQINKLSHLFQQNFSHASKTHIECVKISGNAQVVLTSSKLRELGFDVRPLMSPTIRKGHEILRICLHAYNTEVELIQLLQHIKWICKDST